MAAILSRVPASKGCASRKPDASNGRAHDGAERDAGESRGPRRLARTLYTGFAQRIVHCSTLLNGGPMCLLNMLANRNLCS
jgi:hypothetical protein